MVHVRWRVGAELLFAAGLASCASAPRTAPGRASPAAESEDDDEGGRWVPPCGGEGDERSPEEVFEAHRAAIIEEVPRVAEKTCGAAAAAANRWGEVSVTIRAGMVADVELEPGAALAAEDVRCVAETAEKIADVAFPTPIYVSLGAPPALLPPMGELAPRWRAALRSPAARKRLERALPPEVELTEDGCLTAPLRRRFTDAIERWLGGLTQPVAEFWSPGRDRMGRRRSGILEGLAPGRTGEELGYWLVGRDALISRKTIGEVRHHELCLLPLEPSRPELAARIERLGTGWVGTLDEILLHPRTALPPERRYKSVAVGAERTCAIAEDDSIACVGPSRDSEPSGTFSSVAVGGPFDCALDEAGDLRCWGERAPGAGLLMAGPFEQLDVASGRVCAVHRGDHALECWLSGEMEPTQVARRSIRQVALGLFGLCGLHDDGRIFCRPDPAEGGSRELRGSFQTLAASDSMVCGSSAPPASELRCWRGWESWPRRDPTPLYERPLPGATAATAVALAGDHGCALGRDGRLSCWPEDTKPTFTGVYRQISGGYGRLCAVTVDGRVECDRAWPETESAAARK
jgi:hypothetical protein